MTSWPSMVCCNSGLVRKASSPWPSGSSSRYLSSVVVTMVISSTERDLNVFKAKFSSGSLTREPLQYQNTVQRDKCLRFQYILTSCEKGFVNNFQKVLGLHRSCCVGLTACGTRKMLQICKFANDANFNLIATCNNGLCKTSLLPPLIGATRSVPKKFWKTS